MRIYLLGMPGTGKTSVGKILKDKLEYGLIDLDELIEKTSGLKISAIFKQYGEEYFRNLEKEALKSVYLDNVVISTGGGIVKDPSNKELMKGLKVLISTDIENIQERLRNDSTRPLLANNSLENLYKERYKMYQDFKDIEVENNSDAFDCALEIIKKMEELKK